MNYHKRLSIYLLLLVLVSVFISVTVSGQGNKINDIRNVLILGNSITKHKPNPNLGWFGDWGMAASAKDSDYVHDLLRKFRKVDPNVKFQVKTIVPFERTYWDYKFSKLDSLRKVNPDLIIIHIGENVPSKMLDKKPFGPYYSRLLNYFISYNPDVKIICTSSFWKQRGISAIIKKEALAKNCFYVKIDQLSSDSSNMAIGKFKNKGVAIHPSDAGMKAMADLIWEKIKSVYSLNEVLDKNE